MKKKIYLVIAIHEDGEYEVLRGYSDVKNAVTFKKHLEDEDQILRDKARMCEECGGTNKECPFYMTPSFEDEGCENWSPYFDYNDYKIEEVEYEDKGYEEKS